MRKTVIAAAALAAALLGACNVFNAKDRPATQQAAAADLKSACDAYGVVRAGLGLAALLPQPGAAIVGVIEAAVDPVCTDQAQFAGDAGTVAWVLKNIASLAGIKKA